MSPNEKGSRTARDILWEITRQSDWFIIIPLLALFVYVVGNTLSKFTNTNTARPQTNFEIAAVLDSMTGHWSALLDSQKVEIEFLKEEIIRLRAIERDSSMLLPSYRATDSGLHPLGLSDSTLVDMIRNNGMKITALDKQLASVQQVLLNNPEDAISLPLIKRDISFIQGDLSRLYDEIQYRRDNDWRLTAFVLTIAVSMFGGIIALFFALRRSKYDIS